MVTNKSIRIKKIWNFRNVYDFSNILEAIWGVIFSNIINTSYITNINKQKLDAVHFTSGYSLQLIKTSKRLRPGIRKYYIWYMIRLFSGKSHFSHFRAFPRLYHESSKIAKAKLYLFLSNIKQYTFPPKTTLKMDFPPFTPFSRVRYKIGQLYVVFCIYNYIINITLYDTYFHRRP